MTKKLISILMSLILLCTIFGIASVQASGDKVIPYTEVANTYNEVRTWGGPQSGELHLANCGEGGDVSNVYFKFDVSGYIAPVNNISLVLPLLGVLYIDKNIYIYAVEETWSSDTITFDNAPVTNEDNLIATRKISGATTYNIDITEYVNEILEEGKSSFSIAIKREVAGEPGDPKRIRIYNDNVNGKPHLLLNDDRIYTLEGSADNRVTLSDFIAVSSASSDAPVSTGDKYGSNYDAEDYFGNAKGLYLKYDISNLQTKISKAELVYLGGGRRNAKTHIHGVSNDSWTNETLTWNNTFGGETLTYAPDSTEIISGSHPNPETNDATKEVKFDITSYAAAQQAGDGIISLAIMINQTSAPSAHEQYINFRGDSKPYLLIETEETGVEFTEPEFEIDGNVSNTLKSGELKTLITVKNNMFGVTSKATAIVSIYEGDTLVSVILKPFAIKNDAKVNGGITSLEISSGNVAVTDKTKVKVFMWETAKGLCEVSEAVEFTKDGMK